MEGPATALEPSASGRREVPALQRSWQRRRHPRGLVVLSQEVLTRSATSAGSSVTRRRNSGRAAPNRSDTPPRLRLARPTSPAGQPLDGAGGNRPALPDSDQRCRCFVDYYWEAVELTKSQRLDEARVAGAVERLVFQTGRSHGDLSRPKAVAEIHAISADTSPRRRSSAPYLVRAERAERLYVPAVDLLRCSLRSPERRRRPPRSGNLQGRRRSTLSSPGVKRRRLSPGYRFRDPLRRSVFPLQPF